MDACLLNFRLDKNRPYVCELDNVYVCVVVCDCSASATQSDLFKLKHDIATTSLMHSLTQDTVVGHCLKLNTHTHTHVQAFVKPR